MTDTLGQQLKQARSKRLLSLEQASEATHIRLHYLQALEADDYSVMPSAAQARGFLRNYCSLLEINLEEALAALQGAPHGPVDEVSGPLPQVDILPPPPEPVTSSSPTRPIANPSRLPAPPPVVPRRARLADVFRKRKPAGDDTQSEIPASQEPPVSDSLSTAESPSALEEPRETQAADAAVHENSRKSFASFFKRRVPAKSEQPEETPELAPALPVENAFPPVVPQPQNDDSDESAEKIFAEIGLELRRRRELLSLTPEEVDHHIHVREVFIKALEMGDFSQLPSAVQTRGMLANYATFLDLDTDAILLRFADSLQASHRARHPVIPGQSRTPLLVRPNVPPLRSFMAGDLIFGLALVVMVVALIVWGLGRVFADQAETVTLPTAPSISDVLAGTSMPALAQEVTLIPVVDTPVVAEADTATPEANLEVPPFDPDVAVRLTLVAVERTFLRVLVDGEEVYNGRVIPGAAYTYEATTTVEVLTGNGAAIRVTYNGRDLGLLGTFGQVANFIYTADAIITPVPPLPPSPTTTPPVSPTPSQTPTITPTVTVTVVPP